MRYIWSAIRLAAVLFLLLGQITPVLAQAAAQDSGDLHIITNTAVLQAQMKVRFTFQASSTETIDKLTIIYGYTGHGCDAEGERWGIHITPGKQVQGQWIREGRGLPGMELWWQFEVHDQSGKTTLTERQTLLLMDTRYAWKTLKDGSLNLYWYEGSQQFGQRLMDISTQSLKKLAEETWLQPSGAIRIIVYPSTEAMRAVGPIQDWAGGVTFGEYDLVLIGINPLDDITWAEKSLPHELTHVITETGFVNCQAERLPYWLVEGIAMHTEGALPQGDLSLVRERLNKETLPRLTTLRNSFPVDDADAQLAYAQSAMVVSYLIETYGPNKINQLVANIRTGQTIDQALRTIYGVNTEELDQTWRAEMGFGVAPEPIFATETSEPTRTPFATLELHTSLWTPGAPPTAAVTFTPTVTVTQTQPPTATEPATRTPIPEVKMTDTPMPGLPPARTDTTPWLLLGGGVILAVGLVAGVGIWAIKK